MRLRRDQPRARSHRRRTTNVVLALSVISLGFVGSGSNELALAASSATLRLQTVAKGDGPVGFALHPDGTNYVVEQRGKFRPLRGAKFGSDALDVSDEIADGNEQGFLNAVFSNDGDWLYVDLTNTDGDTEIRAYPFAEGIADVSADRLLMKIAQPYSNHNGGALVVDGDGVLWIGMGDGGSAGDPGNRAQNLKSHLGKILRIIPTPTETKPYKIPEGNIDAKRGKPEIWAYGLRNPWRIDIDESTKSVWIGDVGQGDREEVDYVPLSTPNPNFGWRKREGTRAYEGGPKPKGAIDPVFDYSHNSDACSVTGGVVYRGSDIPSLVGTYLFADFCDGKIRTLKPSSLGGKVANGSTGLTLKSASSFGVDKSGEVYVVSTNGTIAKIVAG